jgi:hypothetical protein
LSHSLRQGGGSDGNTAVDGRTWELVRDRATNVDRAVFSGWATGVNLVVGTSSGSEQALFVQQQRVGAGFFSVLGVPPLVGRKFTDDVRDPSGAPHRVDRRRVLAGAGTVAGLIGAMAAVPSSATTSGVSA